MESMCFLTQQRISCKRVSKFIAVLPIPFSHETDHSWLTESQILGLAQEGEGSGDAQVVFVCCSETVCVFC